MSFLADHIQIRNGSYQDIIFHNAYKPTQIEADSSNNEMNNENVDFEITENEIEAYNDDDDLTDNLFVELSDEEKDGQLSQNDSYHSDSDFVKLTTVTIKLDTTPDATTKAMQSEPITFEDLVSSESGVADQRLPAETEETNIINENYNGVSKATESRCEDVIFGELVTSMLKKMDSPNRKRAKKEILNILLS